MEGLVKEIVRVSATSEDLISEMEKVLSLGYSYDRNLVKFYRIILGSPILYLDWYDKDKEVDPYFKGLIVYHNKYTNEVKVKDLRSRITSRFEILSSEDIFDSYGSGTFL